MRKYGVPYRGSKDKIAEDILAVLPSGKRFVDLFGGGFAMSHAALLSGKYEKVLYNDADPLLAPFIQDCIDGKYNPARFKPVWVSREDFHRLKHTDGYVKWIWSFGNNGKTYLCASEIEEIKRKGFEYAVNGTVFDEIRPFIETAKTPETVKERRMQLKQIANKNGRSQITWPLRQTQVVESLESLERLERLESLERLERLERLESKDYREIEYRDGDVVYCDIPYNDTRNDYSPVFVYSDFLDWAASRPYPVYVSSYEIADPRFKCIWEKQKRVLSAGAAHTIYATERLYITGKTE